MTLICISQTTKHLFSMQHQSPVRLTAIFQNSKFSEVISILFTVADMPASLFCILLCSVANSHPTSGNTFHRHDGSQVLLYGSISSIIPVHLKDDIIPVQLSNISVQQISYSSSCSNSLILIFLHHSNAILPTIYFFWYPVPLFISLLELTIQRLAPQL